MSERFDTEVIELAQWYHYNKDRIPSDNLTKKIQFLEVTLDTCIKLLANAAIDIRDLERRGSSNIILPWQSPAVFHMNGEKK
jgi:hypothetical protein